jgi:hypothetical protein
MSLTRSSLNCASVLILNCLVAISTAETTPTKPLHHHTAHSTAKATAPAQTSVEVINGTTTRTQVFQDQTATHSAQTKVEVINGNAHRTQVFEADSAAKAATPVRQGKMVTFKGVNGGPSMKVMVINGTRWETRNFASAATPASSTPAPKPRNEPVVVAIESSANGRSAASKTPVVVDVASSGSQAGQPVVLQVAARGTDAGKSIAPSVVTGVSPAQPKRPPYRRPGEQAQ